MSQVLDLRRSIKIVRRHSVLVGSLVALGLLAGVGYAELHLPSLTSTTLVVLPQAPQGTGGVTGPAPGGYMATQIVIADSNQVLSAALPNVRPATSLAKLRKEIHVASPTSYIISISADGKSASDAEATANAVAQSYVSYITDSGNPLGYVPAHVFQSAISATGKGPLEMLIITGFIGALAGAVIGVIVALAISRNDKRLRTRDEIANSIGIPVLASIPAAHPSDAAGWTRLLQDYKPGAVHAWRLRKALQQLTASDDLGKNSPSAIAVLSLSSDRGALALGPQLAVFAATMGMPTALVIGPQQDAHAAAALRTACAIAPRPTSAKRSAALHVVVSEDGNFAEPPGTTLAVVVANVDGNAPQMPETMPPLPSVLGVSAGAATAEQLARVAVSAAIDGREIIGILVADPDPADSTTGQIPQMAQPIRHHRLPTRLSGIVTEIRR